MLHDVGENTHLEILASVGATIGDIPFGRKTPKHMAIEAKIRAHLFNMYYSDLPDWLLARCEQLIRHDDNSPTHDVLTIAHDAGAFRTAIRAGKLALSAQGERSNKRFIALSALATSVSVRAYEALEPWANTYDFADTLLYSTNETFTNIHRQLPSIA
ncbi:MAG TPA: hypothetical protein VJ836_01475 [Candidatus Saccharimonadales bacterium]|nr:hypothetical protein [Candidatus Saccharimonadales bacterium]